MAHHLEMRKDSQRCTVAARTISGSKYGEIKAHPVGAPHVGRSCVAKVVKTFGCIAQTTETLDEFRYYQITLFRI